MTRQSDDTAINIGTLSGGYANAAIQDVFCAGTTCTITEIYDQSANSNHLTLAPPGGEDDGTGPNKYGHKVYGL